eukprot:gene11490-11586_t
MPLWGCGVKVGRPVFDCGGVGQDRNNQKGGCPMWEPQSRYPDSDVVALEKSFDRPREILVYDVVDGRRIANGKTFINAGPGGTPDGFRVDVDGNLWCGWGMGSAELDGVRVFDVGGTPIGHIHLPERCANVAFGGRHRNRLFMA